MMHIRLTHLQLTCRQSVELMLFAERLSFFHGEMSAGKSSVPALVDYCLGGRFPKTPALSAELVSVQLRLALGSNDVMIERVPSDSNHAQVSWQTEAGERFQVSAPLRVPSDAVPMVGENVFTFSDLVLRLLGVDVIKVRKRTYDPDSNLVRLSIRDILEFTYLDQDHLDSDFFLLDQPIRKEKSQDAIRYFVGFMSDRLNELQIELLEVRQEQRTKRETVTQIEAFLGRFGFASEEKITQELTALNDEARGLQQELDRLKEGYRPDTRIADEDRARFRDLAAAIARTEEAITDLEARIAEQESLESELISLKFKAARTEAAHTLLDGVEFEICPSCGSVLPEHGYAHTDHCYLCKTPNALQPATQPKAIDVVRQDLNARIADLKDSLTRHRRALQPLRSKADTLRAMRREVDDRVSAALRSYESEFLARSRANEKRLSAIQGRSTLLDQIRAMPAAIARIQDEADALSARIDGLRRRIGQEESKLVGAERNYRTIERNYKAILRAIDFPGISDADEVVINRRTLIPEVWQSGDEARSWNFFDAGSGGKKTLLKICFALALHQTAAENDLPLPSLLMIDSPMKNITPDVNPTIFRNFYAKLYRLMSSSLADWQVILVDQTYAAPPETLKPSMHRLMKRDDPRDPPLIGYYRGA